MPLADDIHKFFSRNLSRVTGSEERGMKKPEPKKMGFLGKATALAEDIPKGIPGVPISSLTSGLMSQGRQLAKDKSREAKYAIDQVMGGRSPFPYSIQDMEDRIRKTRTGFEETLGNVPSAMETLIMATSNVVDTAGIDMFFGSMPKYVKEVGEVAQDIGRGIGGEPLTLATDLLDAMKMQGEKLQKLGIPTDAFGYVRVPLPESLEEWKQERNKIGLEGTEDLKAGVEDYLRESPFDPAKAKYPLAYQVGSGIATLGEAIALSIVGTPVAAAIVFGTRGGVRTYTEARAKGVEPETASMLALPSGAIEGVLEKFGLDLFLKGAATPLKTFLVRTGTEAIQEGLQEINSNAWAKIGYDNQRSIVENLGTAMLVGGIVGGAGSVALSPFESKIQEVAKKSGLSPEESGSVIQKAKELLDTDKLLSGVIQQGNKVMNLMLEERGAIGKESEPSETILPEDPTTKLAELIKKAKPVRKGMEKQYTEERGKRIAGVEKFIDEKIEKVGGEEGYRQVLSMLKGELIEAESKVKFEPLKEKLDLEETKEIYLKTWQHPYLDNWEKINTADGLTRLLAGEIPQPKQLVLLDEVYGKELVKNLLKKRASWSKVGEAALDIINIPRVLMATADMSAFLRQGIVEVAAHPVISAKAMGKTFQFAFSPKSFEQYFKDLKEDPLYPVIRKSKLEITEPESARGMGYREEPFMSRYIQKTPGLGIIPRFAERAYVGFSNKVRVDVFKQWVDEATSKGLSPVGDVDYFKSLATVVNTFTGRGSLGKTGNKIAPALNAVYFSPRLITARFLALNPIWYAKQSKGVRVKAIGDFGKFVGAGLSLLALIVGYKEAKEIPDDILNVEYDPRSSDFGKIKVGDTRFDIWGGFQQWARVVSQLITGQRKNTSTGEIVSLSKDEYPFTTRKEVLLRFIEGKLAPVPALINQLASGAKNFQGEDITPETIAKQNLIPMYIQDIADAYKSGGLGIASVVAPTAFFGVGVQTWEKKGGKPYTSKIGWIKKPSGAKKKSKIDWIK